MNKTKSTILVTLLLSMVCTNLLAYDACIDGFYYEFSGDQATIVNPSNDCIPTDYRNHIVIPSTVSYLGKEYTVTTIGMYAFYWSKELTSVEIPSTVTTIERAFSGCSSLSSVLIPNSVKYIDGGAFNGTPYSEWLDSQPVESNGVQYIGSVAYKFKGNIPTDSTIILKEGTTGISNGAFIDCRWLKNIWIPNTIQRIGGAAFRRCGLTEIGIYNSNAYIGDFAFAECSELKSAYVDAKVIDDYAFWSCGNLETIHFSNALIRIGDRALRQTSSLTSIYLDSTVPPYLHSDALYDRANPKPTLFVPSNSKEQYEATNWIYYTTIKEQNEEDNENPQFSLIEFADANVRAICVANWDINGDGALDTGEAAAVTQLNSVFRNNTSIRSFDELQFFIGLESIGKEEFAYCSNLSIVTLPENLKNIGEMAFQSCTSLMEIIIPSNVTTIGQYAFYQCDNLTELTVLNPTPPSVSQYTFYNADFSNMILNVPFSNIAAYEVTEVWKDFNNIASSEVRLVDGQDYTNVKNVDVDEFQYSRTFKNTHWQAWYVPFDLTLTNEVMEHFSFAKFAGTYTEEDGSFYITVVRLKEGDEVKANTPYCVQAKVADSSTPQVIMVADATLKAAAVNSFYVLSAEKKITFWGNYTLRAVTETDQNLYAMSGGQYSKQLTGNTLAPYRCFFTIEDREDNPYSSTPNPATVKLKVLGEDMTGIGEFGQLDDLQLDKADAYDLSGRRVMPQHMGNGIYIINGKKLFVK